MDPKVGQVINNKYRLVRLIGDGGMGSVFEARHELLGTTVALKFLHPALSRRKGLVERFLQEAQVSARIKSPHVVRVSDVDRTPEGLAYMVMEYIDGKSLQTLYEELYHAGARLSYGDAFNYALQIIDGITAAHKLGIVHRDLKPDNVMLTKDSKGNTLVKILDFGIAKLKASGEVDRGLTRPGVVMGTPEYMAPEQAFSADKVDGRADIFSLGVMFFEMLAGRRPVGGDNAHAIAAQYLEGSIANLKDLKPMLANELVMAVHRAMGAKPAERFDTIEQFRTAVEPFAPEGAIPQVYITPPQATADELADTHNSESGRIPKEVVAVAAAAAAARSVPKTLPPEETFASDVGSTTEKDAVDTDTDGAATTEDSKPPVVTTEADDDEDDDDDDEPTVAVNQPEELLDALSEPAAEESDADDSDETDDEGEDDDYEGEGQDDDDEGQDDDYEDEDDDSSEDDEPAQGDELEDAGDDQADEPLAAAQLTEQDEATPEGLAGADEQEPAQQRTGTVQMPLHEQPQPAPGEGSADANAATAQVDIAAMAAVGVMAPNMTPNTAPAGNLSANTAPANAGGIQAPQAGATVVGEAFTPPDFASASPAATPPLAYDAEMGGQPGFGHSPMPPPIAAPLPMPGPARRAARSGPPLLAILLLASVVSAAVVGGVYFASNRMAETDDGPAPQPPAPGPVIVDPPDPTPANPNPGPTTEPPRVTRPTPRPYVPTSRPTTRPTTRPTSRPTTTPTTRPTIPIIILPTAIPVPTFQLPPFRLPGQPAQPKGKQPPPPPKGKTPFPRLKIPPPKSKG